jgi:membrane fusion protein (multidrug efflux system)
MAEEQTYTELFKEKKKIYLVIVLVVILLIGAVWWWRVYIYPYESTNDANIEGIDISVSPEQGGRIVQLFVDEGAVVKAGDLLFILDDQLLQAEREQVKAMIASAKDDVALQKVKAELAAQDFQRAKREFDDGVISPEAMDHAQKELEAARAQLQVVYAQVVVQEAHLKMVETQIAKCSVYASCDGVIGKRWHFPGDVVAIGQTVFSLFDLKDVWITANLEETKVGAVHYNDLVSIRVDAYPHLQFEGNVEIIGAGAASQFALIPPNNASGNFTKVTQRVPVRISLKAPYSGDTLYLRPGMSVEVKIKTR